MITIRATIVFCAAIAMACDAVRPLRVPSEDLVVTRVHARAARPDDCEVTRIDGDCRLEEGLRLVCPSAPPPEKMVAELMLCVWAAHADEARVRTAACRAGGDAVMPALIATHRCLQEDFETDARSGAAGQHYFVYRLRP